MIKITITAFALCLLLLFSVSCKRTQVDNSEIDVSKSSEEVSTTVPENLSEEDGASWEDTWGNESGSPGKGGSSLSTTGFSGTAGIPSQGTSGSKSMPKTSVTTAASSYSATSASSQSGTPSETSGTATSPENNDWTPNY